MGKIDYLAETDGERRYLVRKLEIKNNDGNKLFTNVLVKCKRKADLLMNLEITPFSAECEATIFLNRLRIEAQTESFKILELHL